MSIEPWNTGTDGAAGCEDMPRKSIDRKFTDDPLREKRGNCTLFCLPARTGLGRARSWVKGWIPCGFLGQRPKPSESFSSSISTVFKVLLSLFFHGSFFIDYLTLPLLLPSWFLSPLLCGFFFSLSVCAYYRQCPTIASQYRTIMYTNIPAKDRVIYAGKRRCYLHISELIWLQWERASHRIRPHFRADRRSCA